MRQRGRDFWCCCPIHSEKTPSLKIDPATQLWHCFGCGAGGDIFAFVMKADDLSFPEAIRKLAERAHVEIKDENNSKFLPRSKKERLKAVCQVSADFFHYQLFRVDNAQTKAARTYLASRQMGTPVAKRWYLGFAPGRGQLVRHLSAQGFTPEEMLEANVATTSDNAKLRDRFFNRIIFPIRDAQGDCIAFGGRVVESGEPKYLNSKETPLFHKSEVLYGLDRAKAAMAATGIAVVVEGYTDVILLHEAGLENVVATLGTSLTPRHIRILSRHAKHRIVYLFDGDAAGQRAADRALQFIDESMTPEAGRSRVELAAVTLPSKLDPADFVTEYGADELKRLIENAQPLLQYGIDRRLSQYDLSRPEGRSQAFSDAISILAPIKNSLLAQDYAIQIASRTQTREQFALDALAKLKVVRQRNTEDENSALMRASQDGERLTSDQSQTNKPAVAKKGRQLSAAEKSRLRSEREFLSLCAKNPPLALKNATTLASTHWHDTLHEQCAQLMLEVLSEDSGLGAAALVSRVTQKLPRAAAVLTSGRMQEDLEAAELALFLCEELAIGDTEEAIAALQARLHNDSSLSQEETDFLFQSAAEMQRNLIARKRAQRLLMRRD